MGVLGFLVFLALMAFGVYALKRGFSGAPRSTATTTATAEDVGQEVARLVSARDAALAADNADLIRAALGAIEKAPEAVARQVSAGDLRRRAAAHDRQRRWDARQAVQMLEGEPVYHIDDGVKLRKRGDAYGSLLFTPTRLVYLGDRRVDLPWGQFFHVHFGQESVGDWDSVNTIAIQLAGAKSSTKFYLDDCADDEAARWWVETLTKWAQAQTPDQSAERAGEYGSQHASFPVEDPATAAAPGTDGLLDFETDIVGEGYDDRPATLRAIQARGPNSVEAEGVLFTARLVPEPNNRFDPNAVLVVDELSGHPIGYLSRALARNYQAGILAAQHRGLPTAVPAVVRGEDRLGVWLDLSAFNQAAGLPAPETFLNDAVSYFERRRAAGQVDGVAWAIHLSQAVEAGRLGNHEVAAHAFDKAARGWLSALAFEGKPPAAATLFEDYARWCRKAKRPDIELEVLRRYSSEVAVFEQGATRCDRLQKRLAELQRDAISDAPF